MLFGDPVDRNFSIVYTPLNGTGRKPVLRVLRESGFRNVSVVAEQELPENSVSEKYDGNPAGAGTFFKKKVLTNALDVVFSLLIKTRNGELAKSVCSYLTTAVYRAYRMVYSAGGSNDEKSFAVPAEDVSGVVSASLSLDDIKARNAAGGGTADEKITTVRIEQEYPKQSAALFSVVTTSEKNLEKLSG